MEYYLRSIRSILPEPGSRAESRALIEHQQMDKCLFAQVMANPLVQCMFPRSPLAIFLYSSM